MRNSFGIARTALFCALFLLPLFPTAAPGAASDPPANVQVTTGTFVIDEPQSAFQLPKKDDLPAVSGSLFQNPTAGSPSGNVITVTGGTIAGHVYGGISATVNGLSENNKVTIAGGAEIGTRAGAGNVHGGWSHSGSAKNNTVTITSGDVRGLVIGGWVRGGTTDGNETSGNTVTIESGTFHENIYGGFSQGSNGSITGNTVTISGGTFEKGGNPANDPHIISGGYSSVGSNKEVSGNKVEISNGTINNYWIYGGRGQTSSTRITGNSVTISGGAIGDAVLSHTGDRGSYIYGGEGITGSASVDDNHVAITDGNVKATIYGGYARAGGAVTANTVDIDGGTVTGDIYGGYSVSGTATDNTITLGEDATAAVVIDRLYGGYVASGGDDAFSGNSLTKNSAAATIGEARNLATVTFGYDGAAKIGILDSTATGSRTLSGVTVDVTDAAHAVTFGGRIEGSGTLTKTGGGSLILTGDENRIIHSAGVTVAAGRLQIGDGESGNLSTPRYAVASGATLAYNLNPNVENNVYGGPITGAGTLEQMGGTAKTGTLILTGDGSSIGDIKISGGTLQLGNGGANGYIAADTYEIGNGSVLAFNRSNAVEVRKGWITGAGTLVQRGSGALLVRSAATYDPDPALNKQNNYSGGTEIENGTLLIANSFSYGRAGSYNRQGQTPAISNYVATGKTGYITFSGAGANKRIAIMDEELNGTTFSHTLRTAADADTGNYVDLISPGRTTVAISHNNISDPGGAFYVADGTAMTVNASRLMLHDNRANGALNDLYVDGNGTFNLSTSLQSIFKSGIDGSGTLNLSASAPYAVVQLMNDTGSISNTFQMGTTNLNGSAANPIVLNLARANSNDARARVTFSHTGDFNSMGNGASAVTIIGDGIIQSDTGINMGNGTALIPYRSDILSSISSITPGPDTLTLDAPRIALDNFTLGYLVTGAQSKLTTTGLGTTPSGAAVVQSGNTGLLDLVTANPLTISDGKFSGIVDIMQQVTGNFTPSSDYLIMRSPANGAFSGMTDSDLLGLTPYVGGVEFKSTNLGLRGSVGFMLGGDPGSNGERTATGAGGYTNVWLTTTAPNSLTMSWTGGAAETAPADHLWTQSDSFFSYQKDTARNAETSFVGGDKVYISGANSFTVTLPGSATPTPALPGFGGGKLTVSGLVAGRTVEENAGSPSSGVYTIAGAGGITANAASAFGKFVNKSTDNQPILTPTGKLEKYGESTLSFENTGGNLFMEGIELHGGTISFTQADQLTTWAASTSESDAQITGSRAGITFLEDATLEARENVTLNRELATIGILSKPGVTGDFSVAEGKTLTIGNYVDPTGATQVSALRGGSSTVFNKAGLGTVRLEGTGSGFTGQMRVSGGTLYVAGNYSAAAGFAVRSGATLSGMGTIGSTATVPGVIEAGGTLRPDGMTLQAVNPLTVGGGVVVGGGGLSFHEGSIFAVRIARDGGRELSDQVKVVDGYTTIAAGTLLNLTINPWGGIFDFQDSDPFTIIDATNGKGFDSNAGFVLHPHSYLPRGVSMLQGWGLTKAQEYQLRFLYDPDKGFGAIKDNTHNQNAVGNALDDAVRNGDPGLWELVDRLSDPGLSDAQVRRQLDQLSGDLAANALYLGFKEPWRHPFNRLDNELALDGNEDDTPRVWAEASTRYGQLDHDGNARGFTMHRNGVAFGADIRLSRRAIVGAAFRYTRAQLEQSNGNVNADDFEAGLYALGGLPGELFLKGYLGISRQQYEFNREVALPATPSGKYGPLTERLDGDTSGHALAASLELTRPVPLFDNFRILPLAALDYERVWMRGYQESAGKTALNYEDASLDRLMFRFGLKAEFTWQDRLALKGWAQYAMQSGGRDCSAVDARFAATSLPQRPMDIRGGRMGRDYANLGFSADVKLGDEKNTSLYVKYDAKLYRRMREHAGELGFMIRW